MTEIYVEISNLRLASTFAGVKRTLISMFQPHDGGLGLPMPASAVALAKHRVILVQLGGISYIHKTVSLGYTNVDMENQSFVDYIPLGTIDFHIFHGFTPG